MYCACGNIIEEYRWQELKSNKCSKCAKIITGCNTKRKGIMIWNHKTAPEIQIVDVNDYRQYKQDTYRRGSGSILRNKSPKCGAPL
jgi:hypothetical protein